MWYSRLLITCKPSELKLLFPWVSDCYHCITDPGVPQRYPSGKGFIILAIGLLSYIIFQIFKSEITLYAFNHQTRHSYNLKYLIEFMIFLLNGIGLGFIYHSNMPRQVEQWKGKKS
jgi:hypothetical protein